MMPPSSSPTWSAWIEALASISATGDFDGAERIARRAITRYRAAARAPGIVAIRAAASALPRCARKIDEALDILRAAAAATPTTQSARRAALDELANDAAAEIALDPEGEASQGWAGLVSPWREASARLERLVASLNNLPPVPPRAPCPAFDTLVAGLAKSYETATGLKPSAAGNAHPDYRAPFLRFVQALWPDAGVGPAPMRRRVADALARINASTAG